MVTYSFSAYKAIQVKVKSHFFPRITSSSFPNVRFSLQEAHVLSFYLSSGTLFCWCTLRFTAPLSYFFPERLFIASCSLCKPNIKHYLPRLFCERRFLDKFRFCRLDCYLVQFPFINLLVNRLQRFPFTIACFCHIATVGFCIRSCRHCGGEYVSFPLNPLPGINAEVFDVECCTYLRRRESCSYLNSYRMASFRRPLRVACIVNDRTCHTPLKFCQICAWKQHPLSTSLDILFSQLYEKDHL